MPTEGLISGFAFRVERRTRACVVFRRRRRSWATTGSRRWLSTSISPTPSSRRSSSGSGEDESEERRSSELEGAGAVIHSVTTGTEGARTPVEFLTRGQQRKYGHYAGKPSPAQHGRYFPVDDADRPLLRTQRGDHNRPREKHRFLSE